jgi:hypothetical protein
MFPEEFKFIRQLTFPNLLPERYHMINRTLLTNSVLFVLVFLTTRVGVSIAFAAGPTFNCSKAVGSIEQMICKDDGLSTLDHNMAEVYAAAAKKAVNEHPLELNKVRVTLLDDSQINAANAGGGEFHVTTGLLEKASDDHRPSTHDLREDR